MVFPSVSKILIGLFFVYILHSIYSLYNIFSPPLCGESSHCFPYFLSSNPKLQLAVFTSVHPSPASSYKKNFVGKISNLDYQSTVEKQLNLTLPKETQKNGTLFIHFFLLPISQQVKSWDDASSSPSAVYTMAPLTDFQIPSISAYKLLVGDKEGDNDKTVSHVKSELTVRILTDIASFPRDGIPAELFPHLKLSKKGMILPIMIFDILNDRLNQYQETPQSDFTTITLKVAPISIGKLRLMLLLESQINAFRNYGFSQKDIDDVKGVFADTNVYLLCITLFVASVHLLLDMLAFKNDVVFWKNRKTMVGLSPRAVLWRAFSQLIIFFYLLDEGTSLLVLGPAGVGTIIEFWKVQKVLPFDWKKFRFKKPTLTAEEEDTRKYDAEGMHYLSYVLYPLCVGGAVYSLLYMEHKSWYSWSIHSLVNCVYAFGFLFMLPQLFINYKLKSVAHLPWKAFMYKAFNTFIDDLFAFIINMPTAHRLACFRDDVVFLIYLYQRWLYPVDSSRLDGSTVIIEEKKKSE